MNSSTSIAGIAKALAAFQGEVEHVAKDRSGQVGAQRYRYADLPSAIETIRAPLSKHGLSVVQPATTDGDEVRVTTMILHASGEWIDCGACGVVVSEAPKGITLVQARGSAITYLRRYGLLSALGLVADDDDGASAGRQGGAQPQRQPDRRPTTPEARQRQPGEEDEERPAQPPPKTIEQRRADAKAWIASQGVDLGTVEAELQADLDAWTPAHLKRAAEFVTATVKARAAEAAKAGGGAA